MSTAVGEQKEMNPTRDDFAALLNESMSGEDAFAGRKGEGRGALRDSGRRGKPAELKVGDTVEVYLERIENALGEAVLSREKARRGESWTRLERRYEAGEKGTAG